MSERWTYSTNDYGHDVVFNRDERSVYGAEEVAEMLNDRDRLAAEVETLRELLREARPSVQLWHGYINRNGIIGQEHVSKILDRIDAALAPSGETP